MAKKLGFALGAGGSRGVAHVGFLQAMEDNGIHPDFISGSSMGAVVGSNYANGMSPKRMLKAVNELKKMQLLDFDLNILKSQSLLRSKKLTQILSGLLKNKGFDDLKIPFACAAVDLRTGKIVTLKDGDLVKSVQASATIPGVFKPVEIGEYVLIDGGIKQRLPVDACRELGADVVVAVDVLGDIRYEDKPYNVVSVMLRTIEIMDCAQRDFLIEKEGADLLLQPDMGDISQYKFSNYDISYGAGYKIGAENAEKIKKLIK